MSQQLPGFHHCIGTARTVADIVFRSLHAKCIAAGGLLTREQLESAYAKLLDSFSLGFDLFEQRHAHCMDVSRGAASMPLARDKILATLLRTSGDQSAHAIFSFQFKRIGDHWIDDLFDCLANYLRRRIGPDLETQVIDAYVDAAMLHGAKLTFSTLLKHEPIRQALLNCVAQFEQQSGTANIVKEVCDCLNEAIANLRHIREPNVSKVTEDECTRFLELWPRELRLRVGGCQPQTDGQLGASDNRLVHILDERNHRRIPDAAEVIAASRQNR